MKCKECANNVKGICRITGEPPHRPEAEVYGSDEIDLTSPQIEHGRICICDFFKVGDRSNWNLRAIAGYKPVVLCKDCKHRPIKASDEGNGFDYEAPEGDYKCSCYNEADGWYSWMPADDFYCAYGERREEQSE